MPPHPPLQLQLGRHARSDKANRLSALLFLHKAHNDSKHEHSHGQRDDHKWQRHDGG